MGLDAGGPCACLFRCACAAAILSLVSSGADVANSVTLVHDGEPRAAIVVASDCPVVVRVAARDLREYVRRMSGATMPVVEVGRESDESLESLRRQQGVVLVGASRYTRELGLGAGRRPDSFRITTRPGLLAIVGRDTCIDDPGRASTGHAVGSAGTLHGVCRFLEGLGVRWFYPGAIGEVVPPTKTVVVRDLDIEDAPYFSRRAAYYTVKGDTLWNWRVGFGPGEVGFGDCHPFSVWPAKYKDSHPEYFAMSGAAHDFRQVCFSHPSARARMLQDIRNYLTAQPYGTLFPYFTLLFNDGCIRTCECEGCQAGTVEAEGWSGSDSGIITGAALEFAKAIEQEHPDRGILLGAYNKCIRPPTGIGQLPRNVAVIICKHGRLHQWSEDYRKNVRYVIEGWRKLKPKEMYFWEYYGHRPGAIMFCPHFLRDDIRYLKQCSERGPRILGEKIFTFGPNPRAEAARTWWFGLNCYVTAKLLWNPDTDVDALLEDYYQRFYGPASGPMGEFFQTLETVWSSGNHGMKWEYGDSNADAQIRDRTWSPKATVLVDDPMNNLWNPEVLKNLSAFLGKAERLAQDDPFCARVEFVKQGFAYTQSACEQERTVTLRKKEADKTRRPLTVPMIAAAPVVDGEVDELWLRQATGADFRQNQFGGHLTYGTKARLLRTREKLYMLFVCKRPAATPVRAEHTKRDGEIWFDDCVEIFLDSDPTTPKSYHHVVTNANAAIYDAGPNGNVAWNAPIEAAASTTEDSWQLEVALPLNAFGPAPTEGQKWAVNLYRSRTANGEVEQQACFATFTSSYHQPQMFGQLVFAAETDLLRGLVGRWTFDEGEGGRVPDSSGNAHHGTLHGDPEPAPGIRGQGLALDGIDDYVDCGNAEALRMTASAMTIALWLKVDHAEPGCKFIVSKKPTWNAREGYYFGLRADSNQMELAGSGGRVALGIAKGLNAGWHHVAGVITAAPQTEARLYVDGQEVTRRSVTDPIRPGVRPLYVGCRQPGGEHLKGMIDELVLYDRALIPMEIRALCAERANSER